MTFRTGLAAENLKCDGSPLAPFLSSGCRRLSFSFPDFVLIHKNVIIRFFKEHGWPCSSVFEIPPENDIDREKLIDTLQVRLFVFAILP